MTASRKIFPSLDQRSHQIVDPSWRLFSHNQISVDRSIFFYLYHLTRMCSFAHHLQFASRGCQNYWITIMKVITIWCVLFYNCRLFCNCCMALWQHHIYNNWPPWRKQCSSPWFVEGRTLSPMTYMVQLWSLIHTSATWFGHFFYHQLTKYCLNKC